MKVVNWLFGSFFRTIGRTIAILLMGGLLYYILASNGVGISDLFLDHVNASETQAQNWFNYYIGGTQMQAKPNTDSVFYWGNEASNTESNNICFNSSCSASGSNPSVTGFDTITFAIGYRQNDVSETMCTYDGHLVQYNNSLTYNGAGGNYYNYIYQYDDLECFSSSGATIHVSAIWNQGYFTPCVINNYVKNENQEEVYLTVSCPVVKNQTSIVALNVQAQNTKQLFISPYILKQKDGIKDIVAAQQETNSAINNQTQQQQQQHQEMMNSTTTEAEDEGSSFFGNFTTEDHGGLNAIITAPLNTIRSLLNSSCTKLTLPLPYVNKNIELPCMNDIYTEHFGLFFSLYQTIILAIISYRCLRSIFFDITGFTNPDDDRIEVMDL